MMKVEEAFPYESMMKRGNQEQGRGGTTIKVDHIYVTQSRYIMKMMKVEETRKAETKRESEPTRLNSVN